MSQPHRSVPPDGWRLPTHGRPTHPGEMLREEFLGPLGLSAAEFARELSLDATAVEALLAGTRPVDEPMAERLERRFGMSAAFWLRLQAVWDAAPPSAVAGAAAPGSAPAE